MMGNALTVSEKQHWKNRIAARIEKRIDALLAATPGFMEQIRGHAHRLALESLGILKLQVQLEDFENEEEKLDARRERTRKEMLARIRNVPVSQVELCYGANAEVDDAIAKRQAVHEDELLAKTELGREVLSLRLEQENLLDTVWLATSTKQIKDLWKHVDQLLGTNKTTLQREALAMHPVED